MTARSESNGHETKFFKGQWVYSDSLEPIKAKDRPCKTCGRKTVKVVVLIPADLSWTGKARLASKEIDACIAPIVKALQVAGIKMRSSCCGHGKGDGEILFEDGRTLIIKSRS